MTNRTLAQSKEHRYEFHVYKNGKFARELVVLAGNALIAEIKAPRRLNDDEYLWYSAPRLLNEIELGEKK